MGASKHFILRNAWCHFYFYFELYSMGTYIIPIGYHKNFFIKIKLMSISTLNNALKVGKFQKQVPLGSI